MMPLSFNTTIHQKTDDKFIAARFRNSLKVIYREKGRGFAIAAASSATFAKVVSFAIVFFSMDGAVRSCIEAKGALSVVDAIRPLGDAGGWTALSLFTLIGLKAFLNDLIGEGEYLKLEKICTKWVAENKDLIEEGPEFCSNLYRTICQTLDAFSARALFSKSLASRKLRALSFIKQSGVAEKSRAYRLDNKLKKTLRAIKEDLAQIARPKKYFSTLYQRGKEIKKKGGCRLLNSVILGVAIPIILLSSAVLSIVGEVGLANQLFVEKKDLPETGHFGEWPFNAIEMIGAAFLLHLWCWTNEGSFSMTKKVYKRHLKGLEEQPVLYNRLCSIANKELSQLASHCHLSKLPSEYSFEKMNPRF